jgi:hypothetical protein
MSVRENERRRIQQQRQASLASTPSYDFQVLTFAEWCKVNKISPRTGRRIISGPDGPKVMELSSKKLGITIAANLAWQKSRERA